MLYKHTHNEIATKYQFDLVMCERMPDILSGATVSYTHLEEGDTPVSEIVERGEAVPEYVGAREILTELSRTISKG